MIVALPEEIQGTGDLRAETVRRVREALGDRYACSGAIFTNGWRALAPGSVYVLGLNPGGEEASHKVWTVERQMRELPDDYAGLSHCTPRFRERVAAMLRALGAEPDRVFFTNAIFVRTRTASGLAGEAHDLFARCWRVHEWFLSVVRPHIVLCLGNGAGLSALRLVAGALGADWPAGINEVTRGTFRDGRWFEPKLPVDGDAWRPRVVVGAAHPSRFPVTPTFRSFLGELAASRGSNRDLAESIVQHSGVARKVP